MDKLDIWESPNKYGEWTDDFSELADALAGRDTVRRDRPVSGTESPRKTEVDEDFFTETRRSDRKYGS